VLALQLSYPSVTDDTEAPVGGRIPVLEGMALSVELRRADGGWASGRLPVSGDTFRARVVLAPGRVSAFELSCFDEAGNRVAVTPDRIAITQGLAAAHPPLSQSISVVVLDDRRREKLVRMLDKGAALPAVKQRSFRTSRELRPGDTGEVLKIHVVEGEHARGDLNHHVGWLEISAEQLNRPLPAGTPVEVKLRVDASRGVVASAFVPVLDITIEDVLQDTYRPGVDLTSVAEELSQELVRAHEVGLDRTDDILRIEQGARGIERDLQAAGGGDHDAADRASLGLKHLKAEVDRLNAETASVRSAQTLESERESARQIVGEYGDAEARTRLALLETEAERALSSSDPVRMADIAEEFSVLYWRVLTEDPSFWVDQFLRLAEMARDSPRAGDIETLLLSGRDALQRQDMARVQTICNDIIRLLPSDEPVPEFFEKIGLVG
jgi:molecular chaperone DnaK